MRKNTKHYSEFYIPEKQGQASSRPEYLHSRQGCGERAGNQTSLMEDLAGLLEMAGFRIMGKRWLNLGGGTMSVAGELARKVYYFETSLMPSCRSNLFVC